MKNTNPNFLSNLEKKSQDFFSISAHVMLANDYHETIWTYLGPASKAVETFLDEEITTQKEKKEYYPFRELIASIKNISGATEELEHLLRRFNIKYNIELNDENNNFLKNATETKQYLISTIKKLIEQTHGEGTRIGLNYKGVKPKLIEDAKQEIHTQKNIKKEEVKVEISKLIDMSVGIINLDKIINELISEEINEKKIKTITHIIHELETEYDSSIKNKSIETIYPELEKIRGYIGLTLHLSQMTELLCHFYERHEKVNGQKDKIEKKIKNDLIKIVNKEALQEHIYFGIEHIQKYVGQGSLEAQQLFKKIYEKIPHTIVEYDKERLKDGIHLRPASKIVQLTQQYGTDLYLKIESIDNSKTYNCRSMLEVVLAGIELSGLAEEIPNKTLNMIFIGNKEIIKGVKELAQNNFGQDY